MKETELQNESNLVVHCWIRLLHPLAAFECRNPA